METYKTICMKCLPGQVDLAKKYMQGNLFLSGTDSDGNSVLYDVLSLNETKKIEHDYGMAKKLELKIV